MKDLQYYNSLMEFIRKYLAYNCHNYFGLSVGSLCVNNLIQVSLLSNYSNAENQLFQDYHKLEYYDFTSEEGCILNLDSDMV